MALTGQLGTAGSTLVGSTILVGFAPAPRWLIL